VVRLPSLLAKGVLAGVAMTQSASYCTMRSQPNLRDVQEAVLILVLLVDAAHEGSGRGQDLIDEDEDGLLGAELDPLANNVDELPNGQIGRD
jgi:hypothetical protein